MKVELYPSFTGLVMIISGPSNRDTRYILCLEQTLITFNKESDTKRQNLDTLDNTKHCSQKVFDTSMQYI